ncbi:cytochrome P450 [Nemania sp. FL0031]|nr:cytochrome P450 [Nemania sp. FL0031]
MTSHGAVLSAATTLFFLTCAYLILRCQLGQRPSGLPPGPPTWPIVGNLLQMPSKPDLMGRQFEKWAREFGPIYSLVLGSQTWIVLNQDKVVRDLLDKRGVIYSSRPDAYLAQDIFSGGMRSFLIKDGPIFKRNRRLAHVHLSDKVSQIYIPYQDLESKELLVNFLEHPDSFINHLKRYTTAIATQLVFGFRPLPEEDATLDLFQSFDRFSEVSFSLTATLLDMFPVLRRLPDFLVPAKRRARAFHQIEHRTFLDLYLAMKEKVLQGTAPSCFARALVQEQEEEGMSDSYAAYTCGSLLQGGMGSTSETLTGFVKALLLFPEVSKAGQAEIDRVCGSRMPELGDWDSLSYVRGCVKENLRWMAVSPLGIPHALSANDEYMGYKLPKGATVICNVRAIHNDASRYPEPLVFDPTRWANDMQKAAEAATNSDVSRRDHFGFGAGRRLCQGIHIAERSLFLAIARLLWGFDFRHVTEPATGREIPIPGPDDLQGGIFIMPRPFPVRITARDAKRAEMIRYAWKKAREHYLDENMQWKIVDGMHSV